MTLQLNCCINVSIAFDIVDDIIQLSLDAISQIILAEACIIQSSNTTMQWLDEIIYINDYHHYENDTMIEDLEVGTHSIENYAPFMLKTQTKKPQEDDGQILKTITSMKGSFRSKKSEITNVSQFMDVCLPVLVLHERLNTAIRNEFMVEEQMRVKKKMEMLESKIQKDRNKKQKDNNRIMDKPKKSKQDLEKLKYTYDYDGGILLKKVTSPIRELLKVISFSADVNQEKKTQSSVKLKDDQVSQRRSILVKPFSPSQQNDFYNNYGQRQTSMIPHINLKKGVVLREIRSGKEQIIKSSSQDISLDNLNRSDYYQLSQNNQDELMEVVTSFHNHITRKRVISLDSRVNESNVKTTQKTSPTAAAEPRMIINSLNTQQQEDIFQKLPQLATKQQHLQNLRQRTKKLPHIPKLLHSQIHETISFQRNLTRLTDHIRSDTQNSSNQKIQPQITDSLNQSSDFIKYLSDKADVIKILDLLN